MPLARDDMDESDVRDRLHAERRATLDRIEAMRVDLDGIVAAASGANNDDEHDPEGSTIAYERAQVGALLGEARDRISTIWTER